MKMKILDIVLKVALSLILLLPVAGIFGLLGEPARELYNTDQAFAFIMMFVEVAYINWMMVVVHVIALIAFWTRREALGALLIAPITVNVVGFHLFLDGGLLTSGALLGNAMLLLNAYFIWRHRTAYSALLRPREREMQTA
jgi:glycerol-3-phosphate acyltransferase PlsY